MCDDLGSVSASVLGVTSAKRWFNAGQRLRRWANIHPSFANPLPASDTYIQATLFHILRLFYIRFLFSLEFNFESKTASSPSIARLMSSHPRSGLVVARSDLRLFITYYFAIFTLTLTVRWSTLESDVCRLSHLRLKAIHALRELKYL